MTSMNATGGDQRKRSVVPPARDSLVAGALAGGLASMLETMDRGAARWGSGILLRMAVGLIAGAAFGWLFGTTLGARKRRADFDPERTARNRVWIAVSIGVFLCVLVPTTRFFFTTFRNQALASIFLEIATPVLALGSVMLGGATAGLWEIALHRIAHPRRTAAARWVATWIPVAVAASISLTLWIERSHFPPHDAQRLLLAGLWLLAVLSGGGWLSAGRLAHSRTAAATALVIVVLLMFATSKAATGANASRVSRLSLPNEVAP